MTPAQSTLIVPNPRDIEAWRITAETAIRFGSVKLGEFNWPQAILSLIAELERGKQ